MIAWKNLPFTQAGLEAYLSDLSGAPVQMQSVRALSGNEENDGIKEYGYGAPLLIEYTLGSGRTEKIVFHTMPADHFGHERASDRARNMLLDHATFNKLPRHAPSLDVGALTPVQQMLSLGAAKEFFHVTRFVPGRLYAPDLDRIAESDRLAAGDLAFVQALADYLAQIHAAKNPDADRYRRCLRDLVGHGEGIMGMLDSYPADFAVASPTKLMRIEQQCAAWRWQLKEKRWRLSQVHGDFHPWNILRQEGNEFMLLDRSRGEWGEPADDVSALSINYILFALRKHGQLTGAFQELFEAFWDRYLIRSGDAEILSVVQPFYVWRALVVAHPVWYPSLDSDVRRKLFRLIAALLATPAFDPSRVNAYLEGDT